MGMFSESQENAALRVYEEMKGHLKQRNGKLHVVMVNSFSKFLNQQFCCEDKYTTQIETILTFMQRDGYEIVDVKFNSIKGQGLTGSFEGFHTLISYY